MVKSKNSIAKIIQLLEKSRREISVELPSVWTYPLCDHSGRVIRQNPYDTILTLLRDVQAGKIAQYSSILPAKVIYGSLPRTTMAYDMDRDRKLKGKNKFGLKESGTFLRMILLLPHLRAMCVTHLYLLPVTDPSTFVMKGSAPCPYSVKDFFNLDPGLYDQMTGPFSSQALDLQFSTLVAVADVFGIKVILDFIPRSAGRDNVLILEHPEWFYWIRIEEENNYGPPRVEEYPGGGGPFSPEYADKIYASKAVKKHISKFTFSPDILSPQKWKQCVKKIRDAGKMEILPTIKKMFGITTAPAFSDVVNDPQPAWQDVTFLRLHFDPPIHALKYLSQDQPPYILYDVIKASRSMFKKPNRRLWKRLSGMLPYYMKKYGVAGARIDMGHALPEELEKMIIQKARKLRPDAFLLAEELGSSASEKAARAGYDAIIGDLWAIEPHWKSGGLGNAAAKTLPYLKVPVLASAETPDTPRTLERRNGNKLHLFSTVLNFFLPGSIPFINSGFELYEIQPLNKGLDGADARTDHVPVTDLNYGKLGFFDLTSLHWNTDTEELFSLISHCAMVASWLRQPGKDIPLKLKWPGKNKLAFAFTRTCYDGSKLLIIANPDLQKKGKMIISGLGKSPLRHDLLIRVGGVMLEIKNGSLIANTDAGSVAVYILKK